MSANRYLMYEIFETEKEGDTKTDNINTLLGYPRTKTDTDTYRVLLKKYEADEWAGVVTNELVNACEGMSYDKKLQYYDEKNLKSIQWLIDDKWFKPMGEM